MSEAGGFTKTGLTVEELQAEDLYGVLDHARGEGTAIPAAVWYAKIRAAEDHLARRLGVLLGERRVASNARVRLGIGGPVGLAADAYDLDDVAYDWDPRSALRGDRWGQFRLNHAPVQSIERVFIAFPGSNLRTPLEVPATWWSIADYKHAQLEFLPFDGSLLNAFRMQTTSVMFNNLFGGSGRIPKVVHVDYTAGLSPTLLQHEHMDVLEAVRLRAILFGFGILTTTRDGGGLGSNALSADGLSRSQGFQGGKWGPYSGRIEQAMAREEEIVDSWRSAQHGVLLA